MPDPDLEIRGGGGGGGAPPPPKKKKKIFFGPSENKGGRAPAGLVPPLDPSPYHDIRFTVVGSEPGLVVHGVGQVSMQTRGNSKTRKA